MSVKENNNMSLPEALLSHYRHEKIAEGLFMVRSEEPSWSSGDVPKRASRSLFQDLVLTMLQNAAPDFLPKILQLK